MNKYLISEYTTYELQDFIKKEDPTIIIPIGAIEQHGPHLPLSTDTDLVTNVANTLAENCTDTILITPTVWAGFSHHHLDFCGTISIRQKTMSYLIMDIVESLLTHQVNKIIFLNGHGGNISILKTVMDEIQLKHKDISLVYFTYWHLLSDKINEIRKSSLNGMAHGGELETSLMFYFAEKNIRKELIEDIMLSVEPFYNVDMFASNKINIYKPFMDISKKGQIGQPSYATKETGKKLIEVLTKEFNQLVKNFFH